MTTHRNALPLTISEAVFRAAIIDYAERRGWLHHHNPVSQVRNGRYITAGAPGFPDDVFARDGVVILAECKKHGGKPTPGQREWLTAAGGHGRLWSPSMWAAVVEELA